jgi:hypothetical protein
MCRTEEEGKRPEPRVNSIEDITRDLGLIRTDADRIQAVIRSTRADYGAHPQLRVPRLPSARKALSDVLRSLDNVDSWIRQEIQRRALKWWRTQAVDYQQKPTIRHTVSKSLMKAKKQDKDKDTEKPKKAVKSTDKAPGKDKKKDKKPQIKMNVKDHPETESGSHVEFHDEVTADLPGDADFQHHAVEHSKHAAGYLVHRDQDSERAEAHLQAANLHARVGNAMHITGNAAPDQIDGEEEGDAVNTGKNGADQKQGQQAGDQGQGKPEGQSSQGVHPSNGQKNGNGKSSGGKDIEGKDLPAAPDSKRNPPGRDSELQVKRRSAGKDERGKTTDASKDRSAGGVTINISNKSMRHTLRKSVHKYPHVFPLLKK